MSKADRREEYVWHDPTEKTMERYRVARTRVDTTGERRVVVELEARTRGRRTVESDMFRAVWEADSLVLTSEEVNDMLRHADGNYLTQLRQRLRKLL